MFLIIRTFIRLITKLERKDARFMTEKSYQRWHATQQRTFHKLHSRLFHASWDKHGSSHSPTMAMLNDLYSQALEAWIVVDVERHAHTHA